MECLGLSLFSRAPPLSLRSSLRTPGSELPPLSWTRQIARKCGRSVSWRDGSGGRFRRRTRLRSSSSSGKSVGAIAKQLDLTETAVRAWVAQAEVDAGRGASGALTSAKREELAQLRRRVKTLEMEREILKKRRPFSSKRAGEVWVRARGEGELPGECLVSVLGGVSSRVLRVATPSGVSASARGRAALGRDCGCARRESTDVRQSSRASRASRLRTARRSRHRAPALPAGSLPRQRSHHEPTLLTCG
jgi:transposase